MKLHICCYPRKTKIILFVKRHDIYWISKAQFISFHSRKLQHMFVQVSPELLNDLFRNILNHKIKYCSLSVLPNRSKSSCTRCTFRFAHRANFILTSLWHMSRVVVIAVINFKKT